MLKNKKQNLLWLLAIMVIAIFLRFYGLDFGKPYNYHPDETKLVTQAGRLLSTHFMDVDAFFAIGVYPPFYTYLLAVVMGIYIGFGLLTGHFDSLAAVQTAYESDPFQFFLLSRSLVAVMGILSVLVLYLIARRLYNQKIAVVAALFLAVNFVHVRNSHFGTVDIPSTFFALLVAWFCIRIFQTGKTLNYVLAAVFAAAAVAIKFSMVTIVFPIIVAHFVRFRVVEWPQKIIDKNVWITALTGCAAFLVACPLIWLDFNETWGGILGGHRFESVGKIGSGGGLLSYWTGNQSTGFGVFYPNSIPETFGIILTLFAALGILYLIVKHRREDLFVLVCIIPLYLLFEKMSIKAMRHILPIIPFLLLATAVFLVDMSGHVRHRGTRFAMLASIVLFVAITQIHAAVSWQRAVMQDDPRSKATAWIVENIQPGAAVAVESFPPLLLQRDDHGYRLYDTKWTSKTLAKRSEFKTFANKQDSLYYIADDFSRQLFTWTFTRIKYPDITKDRVEFFQWLENETEKLVVFKSENPKIQPAITIYLIKDTIE